MNSLKPVAPRSTPSRGGYDYLAIDLALGVFLSLVIVACIYLLAIFNDP